MNNRTSIQVSQSTLKKIKALSGLRGLTIDDTLSDMVECELQERGINPETMRALNDKTKD